jgi:general secretion pathway protein D
LGGLGLAAGLSNSVQRIDVSLKLKLTPQINERNKIRLEIDQTVEDITGKNELTQTPTTSKRAIKTVVVVDDQQTIVLGGLIKDSTTESDTKIPILGDLPLLGFLFKQHSTKLSKTNLLLVLTPYIISSADDFQRIFERKMREHEEFAAEYYGHRKEFRAHVDYRKKTGPFGRMVNTLRREREKLENGGIGDGSESLIGPSKGQGQKGAEPGNEGDPDPEAGVDVPAPNPDTLTPEDTTAAPPVLGEDSAAEPPAGTGQEAP